MLWSECNGPDQIRRISGTLYRMVESQEQVATMGYVDTLEEQAILEDLLEESKPAYPENSADLHYLLKTPFRYPPLLWGSRFGRIHEPSLFYGGKTLTATLAESAYYRLVFMFSMTGEPPKDSLKSEHSVFSVTYASNKGVRLQHTPFDEHSDQLCHKTNYSVCQQLGTDMRAAGIEAFEYPSARTQQSDNCVALFSPDAFSENSPSGMNLWLCQSSPEGLVFKEAGGQHPFFFTTDQFMVDGSFPMPA